MVGGRVGGCDGRGEERKETDSGGGDKGGDR